MPCWACAASIVLLADAAGEPAAPAQRHPEIAHGKRSVPCLPGRRPSASGDRGPGDLPPELRRGGGDPAARVTVPRPGMPDLTVSRPGPRRATSAARTWAARGGVVLDPRRCHRPDRPRPARPGRTAWSAGTSRSRWPGPATGSRDRPSPPTRPRGDVEIRGGVRLVDREGPLGDRRLPRPGPRGPPPSPPVTVDAEEVQYLYKERQGRLHREAARDAHPGGRRAHLPQARGRERRARGASARPSARAT